MDKLKLLMGKPILIDKENNICVHHATIDEIVDMGEDEFNNLVAPFTLTSDALFAQLENGEELAEQHHIYDLFFERTEGGSYLLDHVFGANTLEYLEKCLRFFLRADSVKALQMRRKFVVNDAFVIDKDSYLKIRSAIQAVTLRKDVEVERPPKNMSKRQRDIWNKLQKGRRRKAEKDAIYLQDIINYIAFGSSSFIPFREIEKMTYYQTQNAYKSILSVDSYKIGMSYKLSQKFDVKDEIKHWTETIKIGK